MLYFLAGGSEGSRPERALVGEGVDEHRYDLDEFDDDEGHEEEEDGEELDDDVPVQNQQDYC